MVLKGKRHGREKERRISTVGEENAGWGEIRFYHYCDTGREDHAGPKRRKDKNLRKCSPLEVYKTSFGLFFVVTLCYTI